MIPLEKKLSGRPDLIMAVRQCLVPTRGIKPCFLMQPQGGAAPRKQNEWLAERKDHLSGNIARSTKAAWSPDV